MRKSQEKKFKANVTETKLLGFGFLEFFFKIFLVYFIIRTFLHRTFYCQILGLLFRSYHQYTTNKYFFIFFDSFLFKAQLYKIINTNRSWYYYIIAGSVISSSTTARVAWIYERQSQEKKFGKKTLVKMSLFSEVLLDKMLLEKNPSSIRFLGIFCPKII